MPEVRHNNKMKRFNSITGKYIEVNVGEFAYVNLNGELLFRIETKGRTGKILYRNCFYLDRGIESQVYGSGGSTGRGWGGSIIGYLTEKEIKERVDLEIR